MKESIVFTTPYFESFRCNKIATTYDLTIGENRTRKIEYDAPPAETDDWKVGVIVGPSGSGKTSVAKKHYGARLYTSSEWTNDPIVENFDKSLSFEEITGTLTSVGFSSIPCWLQPYSTLSNGEKFCCDLARALLDGGDRAAPGSRYRARVESSLPMVACRTHSANKLVVFDEFTSVVDRTVAKTASFALRKALDRNSAISSKKFVAVTCHYDVLEWLQPDWILDMRTGGISRVRLRRPKLVVKVYQCGRDAWPLFSQYHYLTGSLSNAAKCYIAYIGDQPCAFRATIHSIGHKGARRVHRTVVLPEFQGIGLGTKLASLIAEYETATYGLSSFTIVTSNAYFARALIRSGRWKETERNLTGSTKHSFDRPALEAIMSGFGKIGRARIVVKFVG